MRRGGVEDREGAISSSVRAVLEEAFRSWLGPCRNGGEGMGEVSYEVGDIMGDKGLTEPRDVGLSLCDIDNGDGACDEWEFRKVMMSQSFLTMLRGAAGTMIVSCQW